jgi:hypothetical protein
VTQSLRSECGSAANLGGTCGTGEASGFRHSERTVTASTWRLARAAPLISPSAGNECLTFQLAIPPGLDCPRCGESRRPQR